MVTIRTLALALFWVALSSRADACLTDLAAWNAGLDFERVVWELREERIERLIPLAKYLEDRKKEYQGNSEAYVAIFRNGLRAVVKVDPILSRLHGQVGSYLIAYEAGLRNVPPTAMRQIKKLGGRWASVQLLIESPFDLLVADQRGRAHNLLTAKHRSDLVAAKFLLGRYDEHPGNLIIDGVGEPALIDSEEVVQYQQVRYGEFPYVRHGGFLPDFITDEQLRELGEEVPDRTLFDFDDPHILQRPTFDEIHWRFCTYLPYDERTRRFDEKFSRKLYQMLRSRQFINDEIRSFDWMNHTWIQRSLRKTKPLFTNIYSTQTVQGFQGMNFERLGSRLPSSFTPLHLQLIRDRRDQFVKASAQGTLIP